ncbi:MAG: DUF1549 domain-containing protein [Planctomycetaceae bacterium]
MIQRILLTVGILSSCCLPPGTADDSHPLPTASENAQQIDRFLADHWAELRVAPAPLCSDRTFVRRAYLDLTGRVPTTAETENFLKDGRENRRFALIELLTNSEDFVQHFTDLFDTLLMGRGSDRDYEQRHKHQWRSWLERVFRENQPWNTAAAEILRARPTTPADSGAVWFLYERKEKYQDIAEAVAPAFFGIRIECAQCHDHMIAHEIEQQHYWGLVAFFNRGKNVNTKRGPRVAESAVGGFSEFATLDGTSKPNLLTFFEADVVEEPRPEKDAKEEDRDDLYTPGSDDAPRIPRFSRREHFVTDIVAEHPLLATAFVNRIWAILLARGLVHPFDEMDSVHPPSHPELLKWLADDFRSSGYDIRRLIQTVAMCRAWQLSSQQPEGVEDSSTFSWYLERPLTAEQLARSIQLTLRGRFANDSPLVGNVRNAFPDVLPDESISTIRETLFLSNNPAINQFIHESSASGSLLDRLFSLPDHNQRTALLFETLFCRDADSDEHQAISDYLGSDPDQLKPRLEHVIWSLLTSAEFRFNH